MGSVALWHMESSQTWDQIRAFCIGRRILNHWNTREVLCSPFIIPSILYLCVLFFFMIRWGFLKFYRQWLSFCLAHDFLFSFHDFPLFFFYFVSTFFSGILYLFSIFYVFQEIHLGVHFSQKKQYIFMCSTLMATSF